MPLYETIIISRAGAANQTISLLKNFLFNVNAVHPNVQFRSVQSLGDRIMGKALRIRKGDPEKHIVGRYTQILFYGAPQAVTYLSKAIEEQNIQGQVLRMYTHRREDLELDFK